MHPSPEIARLVPHRGSMCLHERVLSWSPTRVELATGSHRCVDNPLRRDGRLHAIHLCEYGAQAMAVHGGLCAAAAGKASAPGFLVALRTVELHERYVDQLDGELVVAAEQLLESPDSLQYSFVVRHLDRILAQGRAAVVLRAKTTFDPATGAA